MPTYNHAEFVREAIMSAVEQDYPNLELVAGDDGSTDGTVDIIRECAREYPNRVVVLVGQEHLGATRNANRTLRACRGKYIAFHSGDDVLLPGKITKQVEWLEADERRVICVHDVEVFEHDTGKVLHTGGRCAGRGAAMLVRNGSIFAAQSVMARVSALPPYGFDERLPMGSDWKLWIDCLASGGLFGYVDGVYARWRLHSRNITRNDKTLLASFTDCLVTLALVEASYHHLVPYCRYGRAHIFAALANFYLSRGEKQTASVYLVSARRERSGSAVLLLYGSMPLLIQRALSAMYRHSPASIKKFVNRTV
jgi:glycosyltransferase involved in cell wall biosynthesis